jgi:uncharacterized protein (DUF2336 family)
MTVVNGASGKGRITYEDAKALAAHQDPQVRLAVAKRQDVPPEILYYLAEDGAAEVRLAVAHNMAAPRQADVVLARDVDTTVRTGLAGKIARLAPGLSADEKDKIRRSTHEALEILARDQITVVRQVLAEALKDVADAPADIIKILAQDAEIAVAGPILEHSPVLTDEDLLEIIEGGPAQGGLAAISRRAHVSETVADAVVHTDDVDAIADLLSNPSAQIREETLDNLIERSTDVTLWQAPLVGRPKLPAKAATRLAQLLADNLLDVLQQRTDLDAQTLAAVKSVVHQRLGAAEARPAEGAPEPAGPVDFLKIEPPLEMARRLHAAGKLDAKVIAKALQASDHPFVFAALVVRANIDIKTARTIFNEKSAKGVVAMVWKAGLPMKLAVQVQQRLARIAPSDVVMPVMETEYPLGDDEMNWQLEFYANVTAKKAV